MPVRWVICTDPSNDATYDRLRDSASRIDGCGDAGFNLSDRYSPFAGDGLPGPPRSACDRRPGFL